MSAFQDMLKKTTSSPYYNQMLRFTSSLNDHFGINHFWYYKITNSGHYSYIGTNGAWNEFCFDKSIVQHFTCLRHPDALQRGINLMKTSTDEKYQTVLNLAWEHFNINFNINVVNPLSQGVEAFGFATRFNDPKAEERLLNHLPLLREFTKIFKSKYKKLLGLLDDNQVDLAAQFGPQFYERPKTFVLPFERDKFLKQIGMEEVLSLTPREKDVLKFVSTGYPAGYIAKQLHLSKKTIENYLSTIKCKLSCNSKTELINKAKEITMIEYFE